MRSSAAWQNEILHKVKDDAWGETEMAVEVFCRQNDLDFTEKIRKITNVEDITLIQYNGEYHG